MTSGINYQPDRQTFRKRWALLGVEIESVRVPPVAHAFQLSSTSHLLMFTQRGSRTDGESCADGVRRSTLKDTSGTFSLIPAGCSYTGWTVPEVPAEYLSIALKPGSGMFDLAPRLRNLDFAPQVYRHDIEAGLLSTVAKLNRATQNPGEFGTLHAEALMTLFVFEFLEWQHGERSSVPPTGGLSATQIVTVRNYINDNLDSDLSLVALSGLCDLTPNHFCSAFGRSLGVSPHRFVLEERLRHARSMLAKRSTPITEVALACGFSSSSAFSTAFRRAMNVTPRDYRRSLF